MKKKIINIVSNKIAVFLVFETRDQQKGVCRRDIEKIKAKALESY